ncbi:hypothetical protein N7508_009505 [Penicillium antarcticum]|nr:uncharacterized protein N7508_009505 [Penicillium antarcticum]KAJ5294684.1 hypothetical protein N7508_009505 [Penicillium antarcticum]
MNAKQPEKSKELATSSARIRDNQRRSRTRRKEYVHDLEQRLRAFEKLGVKATQEVQAAGKKVASENVLLRSLLMLHGVTETQITQYLELHGHVPSSIPPQSRAEPSSGSQNPLQIAQSLHPVAYHHRPTNPSQDELKNPSHEQSQASLEYIPSESNEYKGVNFLHTQESGPESASIPTPVTTEPQTESRQSDNREETGQFTSCMAAEMIIKDMQAHLNNRDVRSELGCNSEGDCMVKNMSIFDILDKSQE